MRRRLQTMTSQLQDHRGQAIDLPDIYLLPPYPPTRRLILQYRDDMTCSYGRQEVCNNGEGLGEILCLLQDLDLHGYIVESWKFSTYASATIADLELHLLRVSEYPVDQDFNAIMEWIERLSKWLNGGLSKPDNGLPKPDNGLPKPD